MARRIHSEVESDRRHKAVSQPWATAERLLVCVGPSPTTARVIRTAKRMATALDAPWMAVSVEVAGGRRAIRRRHSLLSISAWRNGSAAKRVTLSGQDVPGTILDFARSRNVTKILIGKTKRTRWQSVAVRHGRGRRAGEQRQH